YAELRLQQAGGARKDVVRGRCRHHDQVQVFSLDPRSVESHARSVQSEIARGLPLVRDVAARDAGALADPRIARVEPAREFIVVDDAGRQVAAAPEDSQKDTA